MRDRARSQLLQRLGALRARAELEVPPVPAGNTAPAVVTLGQAEQEELQELEAALQRIEEGSFGWCELCGGAIGRNRLLALPEARLCISCSSERSLDGERG